MQKKITVLFIGESATLAHIARPFQLAQSLDPAIYDVHFAADNYYRFVFENAGFTIHPIYSRSPKDFEEILKNKGILFDASILEHYAKDELQLMAEVRPDIVIGDLRPSLAVSAPSMGIPYLCLTNAYWSPYGLTGSCPLPYAGLLKFLRSSELISNWVLKKGSQLFQKLLPKILADQAAGIDAVRIKLGLEPFSDYLTGFTWGDTTLFSDPPSLVPLSQLPESNRYIGPVSWSPPINLPNWWSELPVDRPVVYISLGSSGDLSMLELLAQALAPFRLSVVVATAGRELKNRLPKSFYVADFLPGNLVVKRAHVVITNGGSPSSYQALEAGVPVLGLPINMDQFLCMERIAKHGSGILVRSDLATPKRLRAAIRSLIKDSKYKNQARLIQRDCEDLNSSSAISEILQEWIQKREQEKIVMQKN